LPEESREIEVEEEDEIQVVEVEEEEEIQVVEEEEEEDIEVVFQARRVRAVKIDVDSDDMDTSD
jgi:hypothetical protein